MRSGDIIAETAIQAEDAEAQKTSLGCSIMLSQAGPCGLCLLLRWS